MKYASSMDGIMAAGILKKWGTGFNNTMGAANGDSPIKNWYGSPVEFKKSKYKKLNPDLVLKREYKKYFCYSCVIGCGGVCKIDDIKGGEYSHTHKPEYETICAFGSLLMNNNLESIFYINELLNRAGMDSISAGNTAAYAIVCYENNILTDEDTGGLKLRWGNSEDIINLIKMMINREGIGDLLADGVKCAAQRIGESSKKYAIHAGGQEPGMHDPRFDPMMGLHFSADPTPGRHTIGCYQYYNYTRLWEKVSWAPKVTKYLKTEEYKASDEQALKSVAMSAYKQVVDGVGGCIFAMISGIQNWNPLDMLNAATGWEKSADDYMDIGMRVQTLRQLFNIREGIKPQDFIMHERLSGRPPLKGGPLKEKTIPIEEMVRLHWKHFGWNSENGAPTDDTVRRYNLDHYLKEGAKVTITD
jgi:aldehyde:ferredoxin oxidoreductase